MQSPKVKLLLTRAGAIRIKEMITIRRAHNPIEDGMGFDKSYQYDQFFQDKAPEQIVFLKLNSVAPKSMTANNYTHGQNIYFTRDQSGGYSLINDSPFLYNLKDGKNQLPSQDSSLDNYLSSFRYLTNLKIQGGDDPYKFLSKTMLKGFAETICNYCLFKREYWKFNVKYNFFNNTEDGLILNHCVLHVVKSKAYRESLAYEVLKREFMASAADDWYGEWMF